MFRIWISLLRTSLFLISFIVFGNSFHQLAYSDGNSIEIGSCEISADHQFPLDHPDTFPEFPFETEEENNNKSQHSNPRNFIKGGFLETLLIKNVTPSAIKIYNLSIANQEVTKIYDLYQSWKFDPA